MATINANTAVLTITDKKSIVNDAYGSIVLEDGALALWKFDEPVALDISTINIEQSIFDPTYGFDLTGTKSTIVSNRDGSVNWSGAATTTGYETESVYWNHELDGDFDIAVDFDSYSTTNLSVTNSYIGIGFFVNNADGNGGNLGVQVQEEVGGRYFYYRNSAATTSASVAATNTFGGFRIARVGSTVTVYYKDGSGSWTSAFTETISTTLRPAYSWSSNLDSDATIDLNLKNLTATGTATTRLAGDHGPLNRVLIYTGGETSDGASLISDSGNAITLNGSSEYLTVDSVDWQSGDTQGSIEAWVNVSDFSNQPYIFSSSDLSSYDNRLGFTFFTDGALQMALRDATVATTIRTTTKVPLNTTTHVALTSDGSNYKMYINGVAEAFTVVDGADDGDWLSALENQDTITIGAIRVTSVTSHMTGTIDEVAYYDYPLTAAQIKSHYLAGAEVNTAALTLTEQQSIVSDSIYESLVRYDAPAVWWRMRGDPSFVDEIGSLNLTEVGTTTQVSSLVSGGDFAANFGTSGDYLTITNTSIDTLLTSLFTIECWISVEGSRVDPAAIISKRNTSRPQFFIQVEVNGDITGYIRDTNDVIVGASYFTGIADNTKYHFAVVVDIANDTTYAYLNGVKSSATSLSTLTGDLSSTTQLDFMKGNAVVTASAVKELPGDLDDVAIYDYALSDDQVLEHYLAGAEVNTDALILTERKATVLDFLQTVYEELVIEDGPIAFWPLQGNLVDYVGGYDFTLSGSAATNALGYDSEEDSYYIPGTGSFLRNSSLSAVNSWETAGSAELWFYYTNTGSTFGRYLIIGDINTNSMTGIIKAPGGVYISRFGAESAQVTLTTGWHHLVLTMDGTNERTYVDGELKLTSSIGGIISNSEFMLGGDVGESAPMYASHAAYYDYTLTADQISAHYNASQIKADALTITTNQASLLDAYRHAVDLDSPVNYWKLDEGDPYVDFAVFGSHFDGADGATTFTDDVGSATITRHGTVTLENTQKKFGATSYYNGVANSGNALEIDGSTSNADYRLTGDFTIEMWVYMTGNSEFNFSALFTKVDTSSRGNEAISSYEFGITYDGAFKPVINQLLDANGTNWSLGTVTSFNLNEWVHLAFVREGDRLSIYQNGIRNNSRADLNGMVGVQGARRVLIGASTQNTSGERHSFHGYIEDLVFYNGVAKYSGTTYDVPTAEFVDSQPTTFVDSAGSHDLTLTNAPTPLQPGLTEYGTSYAFDGVDQYAVKAVANYQSTDTEGSIEAWYKSSSSTYNNIFGAADTDGNFGLFADVSADGEPRIGENWTDAGIWNTVEAQGVNVNDGNPHHLVFTSNGTAWAIFVDGVEQSLTEHTGTNIGSWFGDTATLDNVALGARVRPTIDGYLEGTIDEVAYYDYPLTAAQVKNHFIAGAQAKAGSLVITGQQVQLSSDEYSRQVESHADYVQHWRFDEQSDPSDYIFMMPFHGELQDTVGLRTISTAGTPTISATQAKFGGTSLNFDLNDYIYMANEAAWDIADGNGRTIEMWIYPTQFDATWTTLMSWWGSTSWRLLVGPTGIIGISTEGTGGSGSAAGAVVLNKWQHIMVCMQTDNTHRIYVDGVFVAAGAAMTYTASNSTLKIGTNTAGEWDFVGYMDDVSMKYGAEWPADTTSFTPPTRSRAFATGESDAGKFWVLYGGPTGRANVMPQSDGRALTFNGTDQFARQNMGAEFKASAHITYEAWVDVPSGSAGGTVFSTTPKGAGAVGKGAYLQIGATGLAVFTIGTEENTSSFIYCNGVTDIRDAGPTHIAGTYDGINMRVYVNGVEDNSVAETGTIDWLDDSGVGPTIGQLYLGGNRNNIVGTVANSFFEGSIDSVAVFDNDLTAGEILSHYMAGAQMSVDPLIITGQPIKFFNDVYSELVYNDNPVVWYKLDVPPQWINATSVSETDNFTGTRIDNEKYYTYNSTVNEIISGEAFIPTGQPLWSNYALSGDFDIRIKWRYDIATYTDGGGTNFDFIVRNNDLSEIYKIYRDSNVDRITGTDGTTYNYTNGTGSEDGYFRIERIGTNIKLYYSNDGSAWTQRSSFTCTTDDFHWWMAASGGLEIYIDWFSIDADATTLANRYQRNFNGPNGKTLFSYGTPTDSAPALASEYAWQGDGSTSYLYTPIVDFQSTDSLGSIEAWVTTTAVSDGTILASCIEDGTWRQFSLELDATGHLSFIWYDTDVDAVFDQVKSTTSINDGLPHHVVLVSTGTVYKMYIDGSEETLTVPSGTNEGRWFADFAGISRDNLTIGARVRNTTISYFDGVIDEVAYYDTELTAAQVTDHYVAGRQAATAALTVTTQGADIGVGVAYDDLIDGDSAVAHYKLDDSTTTAVNRLGTNGTYQGTTRQQTALTADGVYSVDFNGTTDYVYNAAGSPPYNASLTEFSAEAWIEFPTGEGGSIIACGDNGEFNFTVSTNNIYVAWKMSNGSWYNMGGGGQVLPANTVHHVVWTWKKNGDAYIYINGKESRKYTGVLDFFLNHAPSSYPFRIGASQAQTPDGHFGGNIDEVALYDVQLSEAQVFEHYNAGAFGSYNQIGINANTAALTLTEHPSVNGTIVEASTDALILTEYALEGAGATVEASTDALVITERQATVENVAHNIDTNIDALLLTGQLAGIDHAADIVDANTDALLLTGQLAGIQHDAISVDTNIDALILTEQPITLQYDFSPTTNVDALIITGLNQKVANGYADSVIQDGPISFLRFESSSGQVFSDYSGNGNTGTSNVSLTRESSLVPNAREDRAVSIQSTQKITGTTGLVDQFPFTVEYWFLYTSTASNSQHWCTTDAAGKYSGVSVGSTAANDFYIRFGNNTFQATNDRRDYLTSGAQLIDGAVHHIVMTFTGHADFKVYINGLEVATEYLSGSGTYTAFDATKAFVIGTSTQLFLNPAGDTFDEFAIYDKVLTSDDVEAHYNAAEPAPGFVYTFLAPELTVSPLQAEIVHTAISVDTNPDALIITERQASVDFSAVFVNCQRDQLIITDSQVANRANIDYETHTFYTAPDNLIIYEFSAGINADWPLVFAKTDPLILTEYNAGIFLPIIGISSVPDQLQIAINRADIQWDAIYVEQLAPTAMTITTYPGAVSTGFNAGFDTLAITTYPVGVDLDANEIPINANTDSLTITTYGMTIQRDVSITTIVQELVFTSAGDVFLGWDVAITTNLDTLIITELELDYPINVDGTTQALVITTQQAAPELPVTIEVSPEQILINTYQATKLITIDVDGTTDALILTEQQAGIYFSPAINVDGTAPPALVITEQAATFGFDRLLNVSVFPLLLTGRNTSFGININADESLTITTQVADPDMTIFVDQAAETQLVFTEQQADVTHNVRVDANTANLTLNRWSVIVELPQFIVDTNVDPLVLGIYSTVVTFEATIFDCEADSLTITTYAPELTLSKIIEVGVKNLNIFEKNATVQLPVLTVNQPSEVVMTITEYQANVSAIDTILILKKNKEELIMTTHRADVLMPLFTYGVADQLLAIAEQPASVEIPIINIDTAPDVLVLNGETTIFGFYSTIEIAPAEFIQTNYSIHFEWSDDPAIVFTIEESSFVITYNDITFRYEVPAGPVGFKMVMAGPTEYELVK